MLSQQLRKQFVEYFKCQGHLCLPSSSVVPHEDPTLLFTNAGMNQFKELFLASSARDYTRAVTCQKCIRAGGKHNDLENVGHTSRHLTFFEMLGNFSFGDYFKRDAIRFAWELSTEFFGFAPEKIWPSVFRDDDEAFELWRAYVPAEKITRFGEKDNFWAMGDTGPCGPCSELYYDRGPLYGDFRSPAEDIAGERYIEFWNLVFMQYNRHGDGSLTPLPRPCVDTGAGLERVVALQMGVENLFETDVLRALIAQVEEVSKRRYHEVGEQLRPAFHVIADHVRSLSFAIADGAQPSNIERGYVLRKILRRAVRYGRMLGLDEPFLARIVPRLVQLMGQEYPELGHAVGRISEILTLEEEAFFRVLQRGGDILQQVIQRAENDKREINGDDAFKLKDTYGLPIEEIALIAKDNGLSVDMIRFEALEGEARERSRRQQKATQQIAVANTYAAFADNTPPSLFTGYSEMSSAATIVGLIQGDRMVEALENGSEGVILLDKTPFYAEMGGQVGDRGVISQEGVHFTVEATSSPYKGVIAHSGKMTMGSLKVGERVQASIDSDYRNAIARHHTATHLLHWALYNVLGAHVRQAGSVVDDGRLRFDFNHHKPLTSQEITAIEDAVNEKIRSNAAVSWYEIPYEEAQKQQEIRQFFGDKYSSVVRVVDIGFSKELCGGTHVAHTGEIGYFTIAKEGSIAAGVRRIEAMAGGAAEALRKADSGLIEKATSLLKVSPTHLIERLEKLLEENKQLTSAVKKLRQAEVAQIAARLAPTADLIGGLRIIVEELSLSVEELATCADILMEHHNVDCLVVGMRHEGRCQLITRCSAKAIEAGITAADTAKELGKLLKGSGGGKPAAAQAGGKEPSALPSALEQIRLHLAKLLAAQPQG